MMWCGSKHEVILVQTGDGSIYRSKDRGGQWKRLKSLMTSVGQQAADDDQDVSKTMLVIHIYLFSDRVRSQDDAITS